MKKGFLLIAFLMLVFTSLIAQDVPTSWQDLYDNYGVFFATYLGIAGVAMFLGEIVLRLLQWARKIEKVLTIWVLAIALSYFGMLANIGFLAEASWWETLLWGLLSGLVANGVWSSNAAFLKTFVEIVIKLIKDLITQKKAVP